LPVFDHFVSHSINQAEARRRLNLPDEVPVVLFFGLVRPYKGLEYLISAIAHLNDAFGRVNLLVAGEFWGNEAHYRAQVRSLGVDHAVRFDNRYISNEEVPFYFVAADVFAAPYLGGTQSAAITTAAAFGLPLVLTENVPVDSLDMHRTLIYVVPPADVTALAGALQLALAQPKSGRRITAQDADESWDRMVQTIEQLSSNHEHGG
jgi:glycosyltransferase involved in cell wall biosynthesis